MSCPLANANYFAIKKGSAMNKKNLPPIRIPSAKNEDQPATRKMVRLVRDELRSEIRSLGHRTDARFDKVDARFNKVDARFDKMEARFDKIDARFNEMESRFNSIDSRFNEMMSFFEEMRADHHRTHILLEEQHANNRIVLEGYQALWQRQSQIEQRFA